MKKLFLSLTFLAFALSAQAQKVNAADVPEAVKKEFKKDYPKDQDVDWKKKGTDYVAEFEAANVRHCARYSPTGTFLYIAVKIANADLPKGVHEYTAKHFPNHKITDAKKVTKANKEVSYSLEINEKELYFTDKGAFISEVKE